MDRHILNLLLSTVQYFGAIESLSGPQKKLFTLKSIELKINLPDETKETVMALIDMLISIEKGKIVINPKVKKLGKSIFSSCIPR
jgi:hypothetical protein